MPKNKRRNARVPRSPQRASSPVISSEEVPFLSYIGKSIFPLALWTVLFLSALLPVSVLVSSLNGSVTPPSIIFSLALASGLMLAAAYCGLKMPPVDIPSAWGWLAIGIFLAVSFRVALWSVVQTSGEFRCLLSNNLGDACLHLSLINVISSGGPFWPYCPWFASEKLSYPVGPDMLDAMMVTLGFGSLECFRLTSVVLSILAALLLWAWGRSWAVVTFLLGGSIFPIAQNLGLDLPVSEQWKNLFLNVFASQRGMQLGIPIGLLMLISCRWFIRTGQVEYFHLASLMLVALPYSSVHSALALAPILIITSLFGNWKKSLLPLFISILFSALSSWYIGAAGRSSFVRLEPFLPNGEVLNISSWVFNYGFWLFILVWATYSSVKGLVSSVKKPTCSSGSWKTPENWSSAVFLSFILLFLTSSIISFSPWPWDNTKLMAWTVIGTSSYIWSIFLRPFPLGVKVLVLSLMVVPSMPAVLSEISVKNKGHRLFSSKEYHEALSARRPDVGITFLAAAPEYNHPWLAAGHPFVAGYGGWLWSHGLDYREDHRNLGKILRGDLGWDRLAQKMGVSHLLWGPREKSVVKRETHPAEKTWRRVWSGSSGTLYRRD